MFNWVSVQLIGLALYNSYLIIFKGMKSFGGTISPNIFEVLGDRSLFIGERGMDDYQYYD